MNSNSKWLHFVSWLAPVAAVLIAVGLDCWVEALNKEAGATLNFAPAAWGALGANLVVAAMLFALAWLVALRHGHARGPAALSLIFGIFIAVYPWFFIVTGRDIPQVFMWPPLRDLRAILVAAGLASRSTLLSSFLILAGLAGLIFPVRRSGESLQTQFA